jgi:hypothetical protein
MQDGSLKRQVNLCLELPPDTRAAVCNANRALIAGGSGSIRLDPDDHPIPHVTLFLGELEVNRLGRVAESLVSVVPQLELGTLTPGPPTVIRGDDLWWFFSWIQEVEVLRSARTLLLPSLENIELGRHGGLDSPPHITLGAGEPAPAAGLDPADLDPLLPFVPLAVRLCTVGPNGTCVDTINRFALKAGGPKPP